MRPKVISFAFALALAGPATLVMPAVAGPAGDQGERLRLALGTMPDGDRPASEVVVQGAKGRYDRVASTSVRLPLALSADLIAQGSSFKILKSNIVLKSEGAGSTSTVDMLQDQGPVNALSRAEVFTFDFSPQGPLAQNAVSLCNNLSADERSAGRATTLSMGVAVRWQVTTGRFTFKWTDYDRVAPSQEIVGNPDFYADQTTQEEETLVETAVRCEPLGQETATVVATQAPVPNGPVPNGPVLHGPVRHAALAAAPVAPTPTPAATVHSAVMLPDNGKPSCEGGMVRQISSGAQNYICLCPGNTTRMSAGDNGFVCEKRFRRR